MEDKRKLELFNKALDWIADSSSSRADLYNTLSGVMGMTDDEIIELQFASLADFMCSSDDLRINAFVQYERNSLMISLPTDSMNLGIKLRSIGMRANDPVFITDNPGAQIRVKLMAENSLGCHLINLFNENSTLMDVSKTVYKVKNSPDEVWDKVKNRLMNDQYSNYEDLLFDVSELTSEAGEYTTTFYFPLSGSLGDEDGDMGSVSNRYLLYFESEIAELVEREQESDLVDMKDYFYDDDNAQRKMVTAKWGIEEIDGFLYGKVCFRLREPFTDAEKEKVREWVTGQNSDGFGEGLEQREIETEDGDLYVSMWDPGDDYFVYDEAEMAAHLENQQYGGIRQ